MGAAKPLLELEGKPLIVRAVDAALASEARPVVVVLGSEADGVRAAIARHPVRTVLNPDWSAGLASSIRAGLADLLGAAPDLEAVLVAPCDQPALSPEVVRRLAALHLATGRIAAARYGGRNGAPAVFGRGRFAALGALTGDQGARALLNGDPEAVAALDLPELGFDLDTPADVTDWVSRHPG
jgi:CTP:molybdopterin cytidylyltransferase MocA